MEDELLRVVLVCPDCLGKLLLSELLDRIVLCKVDVPDHGVHNTETILHEDHIFRVKRPEEWLSFLRMLLHEHRCRTEISSETDKGPCLVIEVAAVKLSVDYALLIVEPFGSRFVLVPIVFLKEKGEPCDIASETGTHQTVRHEV